MKKGELTTQQIVILIVVIVSFAVLLYFFLRLNLKQDTETELCHNSVIMRSKALVSTDSVPLNCKTNYVCITADGSCEAMTNPTIKKVNSQTEIFKVLADEMANCWWMFGEGKVNYVGSNLLKKHVCSICSNIAFDNSVNEIEGIETPLSKDKLYDYLANEEISGKKMTYAEYLLGTKDVDSLKKEVFSKEGVGSFGSISFDKQYYIVMGIVSSAENPWEIALGSGSVSYGAFGIMKRVFNIGIKKGLIEGAIVIGIAAAGAGITAIAGTIDPEIGAITVKGNGIDNQFMAPTIIEAESIKFKSLNCSEVNTLA